MNDHPRGASTWADTHRRGFTLVETLVVSMLGIIILIAIARTVSIQGRGFQHQTTVVQSQSNSRTAVQVLANELKEVSATGGDLVAAGANSITVRSLRDAAVICYAGDAASDEIDVWAVGGTFAQDDSVLVFLDNDPDNVTDDTWVVGEVGSVTNSVHSDCTNWTEYSLTGSAVGNYPTRHLEINGPSIATALAGGLVRTFEHITYALTASGDGWALTRQIPGESAVSLVENLAPAADSGLVFGYFDVDGDPMTTTQAAADPDEVGRLVITVRARLDAPMVAGGDGEYDDLRTTSVYFRNNSITQTF